eukprot:gene10710-12412_t
MAPEEDQMEYGLVSFAGQGSSNFTALVMREIKVLGALDHQNIVKKLRGFRTPRGHIYLVMEYVEKSLSEMLKAGKVFDADELKLVMHRDLKPSNVLINSEGSVKICDLGFARGVESISQPADYTPYITTRWYRAPEVQLGGPYSPNVDVWSLGCIFAELVTGSVLLCGSSSLDQLQAVREVVGHLSAEQSMCLDAGLRVAGRSSGPERKTLASQLKGQSVGLSHIIKSCLEPDPVHRPSAAQLLNSIFFMDIAAVKLRVKAKQSAANAGPPSCVGAPGQDNHGSSKAGPSSRADVTSSHSPVHAWQARSVSAVPLVNIAPTQGAMISVAKACLARNITDSASGNCKAQVQPARIAAGPCISDVAQASLPAASKPSRGLDASLQQRVLDAGPLSQLSGLGGAPPAVERNTSLEVRETNQPGSSSVSSRFEVMEGQEPSALMCWAGQDFNMAIVRPDGPSARKTIEMEGGASSSEHFPSNTSSDNLGVAMDRIQDSVSTVLQVPQPQRATLKSGGVSRPDGLPTLESKPGIISPNPTPRTSTLAVPLENPQQAMPSGCFSFASLMGSLGLTTRKIN